MAPRRDLLACLRAGVAKGLPGVAEGLVWLMVWVCGEGVFGVKEELVLVRRWY